MINVLLIDDEIYVRNGILLGTDWSQLGCKVVGEASNGIEGIDAVYKYNPDLIITDIKMPKLDGIQMLSRLRDEGINTEVIFLTAYSDFNYAQNAIKLLASDYLLKPFEDGELEESILRIKDRIISKKKSAESIREILVNIKDGEKSTYVLEAIDYISKNYGNKNLSVDLIADKLRISSGHLSRLFKKETGYTILSYITEYRIKTSMILLQDSRYKVYEVCDKVGYRDITYFSSIFKKHTGFTPSEYQKS